MLLTCLALAVLALSLAGCCRHKHLPPEQPPMPIPWHTGKWFNNDQPREASLRDVYITTDTNTLQVFIDSGSARKNSDLFTNRCLTLGGVGITNLMVTLLGPSSTIRPVLPPLHLFASLNLHSNATLQVSHACLHVGEEARIGASLDLGEGALMTASNLYVGVQGFDGGVMTVHHGGILIVANTIFIGDTNTYTTKTLRGKSITNTNTGKFILDGGRVQAHKLIMVGSRNSSLVFKSGVVQLCSVSVTNQGPVIIHPGVTLTLCDGTNLLSGLLTISSNATLTGSGMICGPVANYGTILAGTDGKPLTFANDPSGTNITSTVTNWGCLCTTNGGQIVFGGNTFNYTSPTFLAPEQPTNGVMIIRFVSVGGLTNYLESATSLSNPLWTTVTNWPGTNTGGILSFTNSALTNDLMRFYRVRVTDSRPSTLGPRR